MRTFNKRISLNPSQTQSDANPVINSKYELVRLGEVVQSKGKGKRPASFSNLNGAYPFIKSSQILEKCNDFDFDLEAIIIGDGGSANIHYINGKFSSSDHTYIFTNKENVNILLKFIYYAINSNLEILEAGFKGIALKNISKTFIENIKIPIPPLKAQEQIVEVLEGIEAKIANIDSRLESLENRKAEILAKALNAGNERERER